MAMAPAPRTAGLSVTGVARDTVPGVAVVAARADAGWRGAYLATWSGRLGRWKGRGWLYQFRWTNLDRAAPAKEEVVKKVTLRKEGATAGRQ